MTLVDLRATISQEQPPPVLPPLLAALWWDAKGDWNQAHEIAQTEESTDAAWVHAYLHRKEGDAANARYWYTKAGQPVYSGSLEDEWKSISEALLTRC